MDSLGGIFQGLAVPFQGIADGLSGILNWIKDIRNLLVDTLFIIKDGLLQLVSYFNPLSDDFIIKILFIPTPGRDEQLFLERKDLLMQKLTFIGEYKEIMDSIRNISFTNNKPVFSVTMPPQYGGGEYNIVDFSYFDQHRGLIHNWISLVAWFFFIKRIYKRLPEFIY